MPSLALPSELSQPRQLRITESENKAAEHYSECKPLMFCSTTLGVCPARLKVALSGAISYHAQGATLLPSGTLQVLVADKL